MHLLLDRQGPSPVLSAIAERNLSVKITTVTVHLGRKLSRNYNSFDNSVGLTGELAEGDDPDEAVTRLQKKCLRMLLKRNPFEEAAKRKAAEGQPGS
jgi:hypothetical protein